MNDAFRAAYRQFRVDALQASGPVILVEGDDLVLSHRGRREQVAAVPRRYHELKAVGHVPLALYLLLKPFTTGGATTQHHAALQQYQARLEPVVAQLQHGQEYKEWLTDPRLRLLDYCNATARAVLAGAAFGPSDLASFAQRSAPAVLEMAAEAARLQIDGMDRVVQAWKKRLPADDWKQLHVVVVGSQMPRQGNLSVQYFAKLLGEPGEGSRIVYAEALWEEERALNLLGTHVVDTEIGVSFFGDKKRMHRDLLSDAAAEYLKTLDLNAR